MVTTVTPLTTWSERANALRPRLERLRVGEMPGEAQASGSRWWRWNGGDADPDGSTVPFGQIDVSATVSITFFLGR